MLKPVHHGAEFSHCGVDCRRRSVRARAEHLFVCRPSAVNKRGRAELRAQGRSLREISRRLQVSLSSASLWTRGIQPPVAENPSPPRVRWQPAQPCTGCGRILLASDFHRGQTRCKDCRREYMRLRGDLHRRQTKRALKKRRAVARTYLLEVLSTGRCTDCGLADPSVLEFDHVGPKRMEVGRLVREGYLPEAHQGRGRQLRVGVRKLSPPPHRCAVQVLEGHAAWRNSVCTRPLRRRNLLFLLDFLREHPCIACGEPDPVVLDFHHIGEKTAGVVQLAGRECAIAHLEREIAACEIRCANCHRRETIVEQRHFRNHLVTPP